MLGLGGLPIFPVGKEELYYDQMSDEHKVRLEKFKRSYGGNALLGTQVVMLDGQFCFVAWTTATAINYTKDAASKGYKSIVRMPASDPVSLAYFAAVHDRTDLITARQHYSRPDGGSDSYYKPGQYIPPVTRTTIPAPPVHSIKLGDFEARSSWYEGRYTLERHRDTDVSTV